MKRNWFHPLVRVEGCNNLYHDNSNRVARFCSRLPAYLKMFVHRTASGMPLSDVVAGTMVARVLPERALPAQLSLELTNICNIKCRYCPNRLGLRPGGYMDRATFQNILREVRQTRIPRIHICGNGEATLHPDFDSFLPQLADVAKSVSLVTNGQWASPAATIPTLLRSVDMLHVSAEGNDQHSYEKGRCGGDFSSLINNLERLRSQRGRFGKKTLVNIRVMLPPSAKASEGELVAFWKKYGDCVTRDYVKQLQCFEQQEDVFIPLHRKNHAIPNCIKPAFLLSVFWNGDVPLCGDMWLLRESGRELVGNINQIPLRDIWRNPLLEQLRKSHRRDQALEKCRGCHGQ